MAAVAAAAQKKEAILDVVECWPENWPTLQLFLKVSTQWRVGAGGATGLDYSVLFSVMDRMRLGDEEHDLMFEDIRVMEQEALKAMRPNS